MSLYVCHCNCLSGCGKCVVLYFAFVVEKFKSNPLMVEAFSRIPEVILPLFRVIPRTDWHNFNSAYFSAV